MAFGAGDNWSDIDVAFGIFDGNTLETVLQDWTQVIDREFGVLDYWDLPAGASIYRVFLLPDGLEVDVAVTPEREFGARGPNFRPLFGTTHQLEAAATPQPNSRYLIGLCWHHVLHARACIERHKPWKAEYLISAMRDHMLELACLRLGENPSVARGFDLLPATITDSLADALVRSLDELELKRALAVATRCLISELDAWDTALCSRLKPPLLEFGGK
jgi:hypothetical protein